MTTGTAVRRALISVSDKTGLEPLARALVAHGATVVSTGGTAAALRAMGLAVTEVADVTGFPEMMDGRVKTLHPAIHGALLARRGHAGDEHAMAVHGIAPIDMLVVNLYPFAETVARAAPRAEIVEQIDIGGPAMIRSAAKNHDRVVVVTDPGRYAELIEALGVGGIPAILRRALAADAFRHTAAYDAAIAAWFARDEAPANAHERFPARIRLEADRAMTLRYGENPHQAAALYRDPGATDGVANARLVQGKPLSYNNLADADGALGLIAEFRDDAPAAAIVKHANPAGVARAERLDEAYRAALACDPVSAFGGIVAVNRPLDAATAEAITAIFTEVIIAPDATDEAMAVIARKANVRLLLVPLPDPRRPGLVWRTISGGFLVQERDGPVEAELRCVTQRAPTDAELADLRFAWAVVRHVKSNAIVFARDGATAGIGAGQMSRLDSAWIAAAKARDAAAAAGWDAPRTVGSAVASDAFFPFADGLAAVADAGATAVIQPGGSVRDADVIAEADRRGLAMLFTGVRHFAH